MSGPPQTSNGVLMVRPASFGFNPETAASNAFARAVSDPQVLGRAAAEFDAVAEALARAGVEVIVLEDTTSPVKPDAAFPNNWVSFHADGTMAIYPMAAATRRFERRVDDVRSLLAERGFQISRLIDLSPSEELGRYLEGTGSLILDRPSRRAFAALGPRTDRDLLDEFDAQLDYSTYTFDAFDGQDRPIYHTNVMLSLGGRFAVVCLDVVPADQRIGLLEELSALRDEVIIVDAAQMNGFACNILELEGSGGPAIAMSQSAFEAFNAGQRRRLERYAALVPTSIPTIEAVGGGSVRCMIADIHLPRA
ncbi:amidinotransferase [Sphingomonas sinipercae]|uniref:Amidinotransferase n=1 Tax=Sphingomonas sinipercae TaxID=2714944 RepID=A0A6G7ZNA0_9SPHN|nr:arginine deiminase-related protein [Sphingomonas sinipercae]QIL02405.1 amidinotransferase [Sphingomonas sinipercae]